MRYYSALHHSAWLMITSPGQYRSDRRGTVSTQGPVISDSQFSPSAYYTSDTLTVEFASYAGIAVISIIDEVTGTAVCQEIGHITATANTVQTDISTLPDGNYTLSIVPQTGDEYEGEFTIQRE